MATMHFPTGRAFPAVDFDEFGLSSPGDAGAAGGGGGAAAAASPFFESDDEDIDAADDSGSSGSRGHFNWLRGAPVTPPKRASSPAAATAATGGGRGLASRLLSALVPVGRTRQKRKMDEEPMPPEDEDEDDGFGDGDCSFGDGAGGAAAAPASSSGGGGGGGGRAGRAGAQAKSAPSPTDDVRRRTKPNALKTLMKGASAYFSGVFARVPFRFAQTKANTACFKCKMVGEAMKCGYCDRYFCAGCLEGCEGCGSDFCPTCITTNYDATDTRAFCLTCESSVS